MPKGDYQQLKADIEDGTVPIAHLLLEACSMAKLNGVAKGLVMFIWRRTYGWVDEGKRKHKDDRITLAEFAQATGSAKTYVSTQLKLLVKSGVILESVDPDNARYKRYGMNTEISEWSSEVIDIDELQEAIDSKLYIHSSKGTTLTVKQSRNGLTNAEGLAIAKPFSDTLTKPFSDHETFRCENPSDGAADRLSKESIKEKDLNTAVNRARTAMEEEKGSDEPTVFDYAVEIQNHMIGLGVNPNYLVRDKSWEWVKSFHASNVPIDFLKRGIDYVFEREEKKRGRKNTVNSFAFCAPTIEEVWLRKQNTQVTHEIKTTFTAERKLSRNDQALEEYARRAGIMPDERAGDFVDVQTSVIGISASKHHARDD